MMVHYGATMLLLEGVVHQARADTAAAAGRTADVETEAQAQRIRADAADFLSSVRAAYLEMRGEPAGAVMEVIYRRRIAHPMPEGEPDAPVRMCRCSRCGESKERVEFYTIRERGVVREDRWCSECRRVTKRKRTA